MSPVRAAAVAAVLVVVLAVAVTAWATGVVPARLSPGAADRGSATVEPVASGRSTGFVPRSRFDVRPVGDLLVASRSFTADRQDVWFDVAIPADTLPPGVTSGFQGVGLVAFWEPGAYDASTARDGETVDLNGVPGWYGDQTVETYPGVTDHGPAVTWQYAAGAWAVAFGLQPEHRTAAFERELAGSVVATSSAVTVPVRLTAASAGLVRQALSIDYGVAGGGDARSPAAGTTTYAMSYSTSAGSGDDPDYVASRPRAGRRHHAGHRHVAGARVDVGVSWRDSLTPALDPRWLAFTPASSRDDPSGWFTAADAFP